MSRLLLLLLVLIPRAMPAQRMQIAKDSAATIYGVVRDSISGGALSNAAVQLVLRDDPSSPARTALSDSLGNYVLSNVPLGKYSIGFFHPILDSLAIDAPFRNVDVESYASLVADLAVPSAAVLRKASCLAQPMNGSAGVIIGSVNDTQDGSLAAGATVRGEWIELALNRAGLARRLAHRTALTNGDGRFTLCDVPSSGLVALSAVKGADSTGVVEVEMPPGGFMRRALYLGRSGNGRIGGTVVSVASNQPIAGAVVSIVNGPEARTNERGEWSISNAPGGTRRLELRALGYYPVQRTVDIVASSQPLRIAMSTFKAVLDTVKVIARRLPNGPDDGGFLRRRRSGMGKYITSADIARFPVVNTSDVFRRFPRVRTDGGNKGKIQMRGAFQSNQGQLGGENWCNASIFINGHNMSFMTLEDIDDWVPPDEIAGIEVYPDGTVPPQFQPGLSGCGSVVIWTK
jgi:hypothetical protein